MLAHCWPTLTQRNRLSVILFFKFLRLLVFDYVVCSITCFSSMSAASRSRGWSTVRRKQKHGEEENMLFQLSLSNSLQISHFATARNQCCVVIFNIIGRLIQTAIFGSNTVILFSRSTIFKKLTELYNKHACSQYLNNFPLLLEHCGYR